MAIVLAAPYRAPTPEVFTRWQGLKMTWTGWDGSVWDLTDPATGVCLTSDGLEGLGMPDFTNQSHSSAVVHGVEWDSWTATARKVFWPVVVYAGSATDTEPSTTAWLQRHRAFWRTLRPGTTGVWTVELPSGEKFSLRLRLDTQEAHQYKTDPLKKGWEVYGIALFAEQPFWEGELIARSWSVGEQYPFYGEDGYGPPFYISPASQLATATISNPGDVEVFLQWKVSGPASSVTVGIDGDITTLPVTVPSGSTLLVDYDPLHQVAELDGVDVMDQLDFDSWNPTGLQPGEDVKLSLAMTGTGSIEARFAPRNLMVF